MRGAVVALVILALNLAGCGGGKNSSGNPAPPPAPSASISPVSLAFGDKTVGTSSAAQTVTLSNTGNVSSTIGSISVSGDFQLSHNCGSSLAAGASCTIQVIFKPAGTGARLGTLTIQDSASGSPHTVSLSGTGVSPANTSVTMYVAPDGNDAFSGALAAVNAGRTDGPFATFDRARRAVQSLDKTGLRQVIVQFRGGTYYLSDPIRFTAADSGSASMPIIYRNYPDETPVFSGGMLITGWTLGAGNAWTTRLNPAQVRYFEQLFVNGVRRFRPRANRGNYLRNAGAVYLDSPSPSCKTQVGDQYRCYDRFRYEPGDLDPNWVNLKAPSPSGDIEICVFEKWTMAKMRLQSLDEVNHIAYLTGPTAQDGQGSQNHGFLMGHRYLVENVKDALSQPGQWFLDRSTDPWTLTYLPLPGEDLATAEVIAPQIPQLILADRLSYVAFQGLSFSHDNWVVPPEGHPSQQGEHDVSAALSLTNCSQVIFDTSVIAHTGGWGIEFVSDTAAASSADQVIHSMIYDIGAGGVRIGQWANKADTDSNVPQFNTVADTVVAGVGRVLIAGPGIWIGNSHDNSIVNNEVYDTYNTGIEVCMPSQTNCRGQTNSNGPFNNTVGFNHVYQIGQGVSDDMGAIYVGTAASGIQVLNNRCHDVIHAIGDPDGYGGNGIYLDNITSGVTVMNNLVYRASQAAFQTTSGPQTFSDPPNIVQNNIFAFSLQGTLTHAQVPADAALLFHFRNNLVLFDRGNVQRRGGWYCYNLPCTSIFNFTSNAYWHTNGQLAASPSAFFTTNQNGQILKNYSFDQWQALGEDQGSVIADPGFVNPAYPADDFSLRNSAVAAKVGFVPFDVKAPGRTSAIFVPPFIPAAFPLQLLDPAKDY